MSLLNQLARSRCRAISQLVTGPKHGTPSSEERRQGLGDSWQNHSSHELDDESCSSANHDEDSYEYIYIYIYHYNHYCYYYDPLGGFPAGGKKCTIYYHPTGGIPPQGRILPQRGESVLYHFIPQGGFPPPRGDSLQGAESALYHFPPQGGSPPPGGVYSPPEGRKCLWGKQAISKAVVAKATKATENREEKVWPIDGGYWMVGCWMCSSGRGSPPPQRGKSVQYHFAQQGGFPIGGDSPQRGESVLDHFTPQRAFPHRGGMPRRGRESFIIFDFRLTYVQLELLRVSIHLKFFRNSKSFMS